MFAIHRPTLRAIDFPPMFSPRAVWLGGVTSPARRRRICLSNAVCSAYSIKASRSRNGRSARIIGVRNGGGISRHPITSVYRANVSQKRLIATLAVATM